MRVAALYDIHGNIDALDAVLEDVEREGIDRIVIGGDIAWGPFPVETIARLREFDAEFVRGNADREVADGVDSSDAEPWVREVTSWCAARLSKSDREFLATRPESVVIEIDGIGDVFFCHATPRSDDEIITAITAEEDVRSILAGIRQRIAVCGHTHSQYDRTVGEYRLINAGSVGLPYEDAPGAYWAELGDRILLRRTAYEFARAAARIRRSGCPDAEGFAEAVASPMAASSAAEFFERQRRG